MLGVGGLNTFVSYDNAQSIALKAQYIVNNNLAGAIIWEITGDYLETTVGSGVIANTPLVDTLNYVFCNIVLPPTCTVPTTLTATPAATSVSLNWASTGSASYQIQIRPTSSAVWTTTTSTTNSKTINSLIACTSYEYKVQSVCSNALASGYSTGFGFQTTGCTPTCTVPTALTATPAATSVSLNWASTGAASYQVQYKLATATTWTNVISNANNCTINGLAACANYEYKVQSVCSNALASGYSTVFGFQTTGCANAINCLAPTTFYFNNTNYIPLGEVKLGQGRLSPVWGVPVDAYIPQNRLTWAISMVHAAHLFRNVAQTDKIPVDFYWATAVKESFGGCDANIIALPAGTPYPLSYQAAATGDGCFQIEGNSAYNELIAEYPQRYPVGQHSALIGGSNFETASLSKAYYDIFTVKYWEINKGWNPSGFFNTATDPNAAVKLMAVAYNRGLWYGSLATVLNTNRANAIVAPSISPYFTDNSYGYDYQNALTKYVLVLGDKLNQVPIAEQTNNSFGSYYNPAVSWADIDSYITKIAPLYPEVNFTTVRAAVQATFNSINAGGTISFRYNLGAVLNTLILNLPADDPSANVATNYGCFEGTPTGGGDTGGGGTPGAPAPNNYCSSYSLNATQEWIQSFSLGTLNNNSGNNSGFGNFADQSTNLTIGSSATVSFAAGYTGTPATEYCTVLIDYNRNGSFTDAGETVISTTTNNSNVFSQTINIPSTASQGYARMRVQLKRNASATECDIYSGGEVEDYLVNLVTTSGKNANNFVADAMLYPNPGNDVLNINTHLLKNATNTISLVDVFGKTIRTLDVAPNNTGNYITNFNNLGNLPSGIYFVVIRSNNTIVNTLKWLKN